MRTKLFILAALITILVCLGIAATQMDNSQPMRSPEVVRLEKELNKTRQTMELHDAVKDKALQNADEQIIELNRQKNVLCTQIKANRLIQPLCP